MLSFVPAYMYVHVIDVPFSNINIWIQSRFESERYAYEKNEIRMWKNERIDQKMTQETKEPKSHLRLKKSFETSIKYIKKIFILFKYKKTKTHSIYIKL